MQPNPTNLLSTLEISNPLTGFYDTPDQHIFKPFTAVGPCIFSSYQDWMKGKSIILSEQNSKGIECPGAGYWNCNVASVPREHVAHFLAVEEGLKASQDLMCQWLANHPPYRKKHKSIVIGPLRMEQYEYLKTITFWVNPDQLSMLITGAEYQNASISPHPVTAAYSTGCQQLAAIFDDYNSHKAVIGGTDIAMRQYLPKNTLTFTVTKPMFEQLCRLDEKSFLYQSFWSCVKQARQQPCKVAKQ